MMNNEPLCAIAWSTGLIEFVKINQAPSGCMMLGRSGVDGPSEHDKFKEFVAIKARHSHGNEALLVPGVPEAENEISKMNALYKWANWVFGTEPVMVIA